MKIKLLSPEDKELVEQIEMKVRENSLEIIKFGKNFFITKAIREISEAVSGHPLSRRAEDKLKYYFEEVIENFGMLKSN